MKQYIHPFYVKCIILTFAIFFLQHMHFSMEKRICFGVAQATLPPQWEEDADLRELRERFASGSGSEGTYFNMGDGSWSYCPGCAYHISIDEVTVYGTFTGPVETYAPSTYEQDYSDIWYRSPSEEYWKYWNYEGGANGNGSWQDLPPQSNYYDEYYEGVTHKKIQAAYLQVEGVGGFGAYAVESTIRIENVGAKKRIYISSTGITSAGLTGGEIVFSGNVEVYVDGQLSQTLPLALSGSVVYETGTYPIGNCNFLVFGNPQQLSVKITAGYIYSSFAGNSIPTPSMTSETYNLKGYAIE